jgi:hypothetical protein
VWVEDKLLRRAGVEGFVSFGCFGERYDCRADDLCDGQTIVENSLHELTVVLQHGRLACVEAVRLRPAKAEAHFQISGLAGVVCGSGIFCDIEAGDADAACGANDGHERVENCRGGLLTVLALRPCFKSDGIDCSVNFRLAYDCSDEFAEVVALGEVDWSKADACGVLESLGNHVADHDDGGTEDLGGGGSGEAYRACSGDVDDGANAYASHDGTVEAGGENVGEHGEVFDLRHGLGLVGEFDEVEVGVGDKDVLGLATDPAAHVDIPIGTAGATGIDVEADAGLLLAAGEAAAAGDVEGNGDEIADLEVLDVRAGFDDFAGDLVAEDHAGGGGGAPANHVLIGAADIGGDDLQDDAMINFLACRILHLREVDGLDFNLVLPKKNYSCIFSHFETSLQCCRLTFVLVRTLSCFWFDAFTQNGELNAPLPILDSSD